MITSTSNTRVKRLVRLADRSDRDAEGVFLVEGFRAIERLIEAGRRLNELYISTEWAGGDELIERLISRAEGDGAEVVYLGREAFAKCTYRDRPEGVIGVANQWETQLHLVKLSDTPLLLIAEGIEKPGNLGSILRSADACGCDAVILCDSLVDRFNPNVIRSSTGVVFSLPVVRAARADTIKFLQSHGIQSVATTPDTPTALYDVDLTIPTAVIMGAEDTGLSNEWLSECDHQVRLPMLGQADSLNVAMATVVTLYEAVRQRGLAGGLAGSLSDCRSGDGTLFRLTSHHDE